MVKLILIFLDNRLRTVLSVVGPDALKKSRRDEERAKRAHEEVNTHPNKHKHAVHKLLPNSGKRMEHLNLSH